MQLSGSIAAVSGMGAAIRCFESPGCRAFGLRDVADTKGDEVFPD